MVARVIYAAASLLLLVPALEAQCQLQELIPVEAQSPDHAGYGVGIDDDVMIFGAVETGDQGPFTGAAYIYRLIGDTWMQEQRLLASDASRGSWFGFAADIKDDVCAVGSHLHDLSGLGEGAVYIFRFDGTTWNEELLLSASDAVNFAQFGSSVKLADKNTLIVGAPRANGSLGATYLYRYDGTQWNEDHIFTASDATVNDRFGTWAAIQEPLVAIGATSAGTAGQAYVFRDTGGGNWIEEAILVPSDGVTGDQFGRGVALDGDTVAVSAVFADVSGAVDSGAAYVFRDLGGGAWTEEAKLTPSWIAQDAYFGRTVEMEGDTIIVGAVRDNLEADNAGAGYAFERSGTTWSETAVFRRRGAVSDEWFGGHLDLNGDYVAIGGYHVDAAGADSGIVVVYSRPEACHATCYGQDAGNTSRLLAYGETKVGGTLNLIYENPAGAPINATALIALAPTNFPTAFGTVLIDPLLLIAFQPPPVAFGTVLDRPAQIIPLPVNPGLVGLPVYVQGAFFSGPVFSVDGITELSNGVSFTFCQ